MEAAQLLLRPAAARGCLNAGTKQALGQQTRTQATSARARRTLNIRPHPTFLGADSRQQQDHIIFNPPSAAPSVYHTPFKFLPKTDPRRRANLASLFESHFSNTGAPSDAKITNIPALRPSAGRDAKFAGTVATRGPATRGEVDQMRALREEDAHKWSVTALAAKFNLPRGFVMACCQAPKEKLEFERRKLELVQQRWGPIRSKAREERSRRKEMLYKGEI